MKRSTSSWRSSWLPCSSRRLWPSRPDTPAESFYTPAALNAMGLRAQAEAQYFLTQGPSAGADDRIVSVGQPASSFYTAAALNAMGQRANAQANYYLTQGIGRRLRRSHRRRSRHRPGGDRHPGVGQRLRQLGQGRDRLAGAAFALLLGVGLLATLRRSKVAHA